jgi:uncharacterized membrane protein YqaE (UPF0057 family)
MNDKNNIKFNIIYPSGKIKYYFLSRSCLSSIKFKSFLYQLNILNENKHHILLLDNKILNNYTFQKWINNTKNNNYNIKNNNDNTKNNNDNTKNNNYYDSKNYNILLKDNYIIELIPHINGGFITELFSAVINLFKLLAGIPNFILFILRFILWLIQFLFFIITTLLQIISKDGILALFKYVTFEIIMAPFKFIILMIRKLFNNFGNVTLAALSGADNVKQTYEEEPTEFHSTNSSQEKCYKNSDGQIPFSVIIATILCPPIGVFMEYGLFGWFNILICSLLTLAFYFPGLIYALILLYC